MARSNLFGSFFLALTGAFLVLGALSTVAHAQPRVGGSSVGNAPDGDGSCQSYDQTNKFRDGDGCKDVAGDYSINTNDLGGSITSSYTALGDDGGSGFVAYKWSPPSELESIDLRIRGAILDDSEGSIDINLWNNDTDEWDTIRVESNSDYNPYEYSSISLFIANDKYIDGGRFEVQLVTDDGWWIDDIRADWTEADPAVSVSPGEGSYSLGELTVGESKTKSFTVENTGDATLDAEPSLTGSDTDQFSITNGQDLSLDPGGEYAFDVEYAPDEAGTHQVDFEIDHNAPNIGNPWTATLSGEANPQLATVNLRVENVEGGSSTVPKSNGVVELYDGNGNFVDDDETTAVDGGAGRATFENLSPSDDYTAQIYHDSEGSALNVTEYWGEKTGIEVSSGETADSSFTRYQPYLNGLDVYDEDGDPVTEAVQTGTPLTVEVTVKNGGAAQNVQPRLVLDDDKDGSNGFIYDKTRPKEVVTTGDTNTFSFSWTPEEPGDVYRTYVINGVVPDGDGGFMSGPTGSGAWGDGPLVSVTGQVEEIVISEISVNGKAFSPDSDDISALSPGDNIQVEGYLEDENGNRAYTDQFGAGDELGMVSAPASIGEKGEFSYETEVRQSALTGKRNVSFYADGGRVVKILDFGIKSEKNSIESEEAKEVAKKTLDKKYGIKVSKIKSNFEDGEYAYKRKTNLKTNTYEIRSENDVNRENYRSIIRAFQGDKTNPWAGKPDQGRSIRQAAFDVREEVGEGAVEETLEGVGSRAWDIAGSPGNLILVGSTVASCAATIASVGGASPLCVGSAVVLKKSLAVQTGQVIANEAMYQAGVDKKTREYTIDATSFASSAYSLGTATGGTEDVIDLVATDTDLTFQGKRYAKKIVRDVSFASAVDDRNPRTTKFEEIDFRCEEKSVGGGCSKIDVSASYKGKKYSFNIDAIDSDEKSPDPILASEVVRPKKVRAGEKFKIKVRAKNKGGLAKYGSVSASFPDYNSSEDESLVEAGDDISSGDEPGFVEVPAGDDLFTKEGEKKEAKYLLAEYADDTWESGEVNALDLTVEAPSSPGTFEVFVRASLTTTDEGYNVPGADSDAETTTDQQGWQVFRIPVEVQEEETSTASVSFEASEAATSPGGTGRVDLSVRDFESVSGTQFTLNWDPSVASFSAVKNFNLDGLSSGNFGTPDDENIGDGTLTVSWEDPDGEEVTLPDGASVFELELNATGEVGDRTSISFGDNPTSREVTVGSEAVTFKGADGGLEVSDAFNITGAVYYYSTSQPPLSGAGLQMSGDASRSTSAGEDGSFLFENVESGEYTLTPSKEVSTANRGITTLDLILTRRDVLGIESLGGPYRRIAADVNASGDVTTADIAQARQVILGLSESLTEGFWRFVPTDHEFSDPTDPWSAPARRSYGSLSQSKEGQNFTAVKRGDVNGSWSSEGSSAAATARSTAKAEQRPIELSVKDQTVSVGDTASVPIQARSPRELAGLQFTIRWAPDRLTFVGGENYGLGGLSARNLGTTQVEQGALTVAWSDPKGRSQKLPSGESVMDLRFRVDKKGDADIRFASGPTPPRAYGGEGLVPMSLAGNAGALRGREAPEDFGLSSNYPNPARQATTFEYALPESKRVTMEVYDLLGQRVATPIEGARRAGRHAVTVELGDLASGMYVVRFQAGSFRSTRKIVVTR